MSEHNEQTFAELQKRIEELEAVYVAMKDERDGAREKRHADNAEWRSMNIKLRAKCDRLERLLRDVLPHLEGGHDEARIWTQNVRSALEELK